MINFYVYLSPGPNVLQTSVLPHPYAHPLWLKTFKHGSDMITLLLKRSFLLHLEQEWQTSSLKGQVVNISGFAGHTVSATTTQLPCRSVKAATDNM